MRIATLQGQLSMLRSTQENQAKAAQLVSKMSTGDKFTVPSEDPVAGVRLSRLKQEQAVLEQYRNNIGAVRIHLQKNETYLQSMVNDMHESRDLLVWALNGSNTSSDLNAMAGSLSALRDSLFYSSNEVDQEGHYLFSGTASNTPAIAYDPAQPVGQRYTFAGNTNAQQVMVGNGITQTVNTDAQGLDALLNQMDRAIASLAAPGVNPNDPAVRDVLSANLKGVDTTSELVAGKIATLGGAQNILSTIDDNHSNVMASNSNAQSDLGNLDYSAAVGELASYTLAIEATYKAYGKISNLSIFSVM